MSNIENYPMVTIGRRRNERNEPLVEVRGEVIGTLNQLREFLDEYQKMQV